MPPVIAANPMSMLQFAICPYDTSVQISNASIPEYHVSCIITVSAACPTWLPDPKMDLTQAVQDFYNLVFSIAMTGTCVRNPISILHLMAASSLQMHQDTHMLIISGSYLIMAEHPQIAANSEMQQKAC